MVRYSRLARGRRVAIGVTGIGLVAAATPSCKLEPRIEERMLVVYSPRSCPVSQSEAFSVIYGNGDFEDAQSAVSSLYLRDVGSTLTDLPARTRSVIVDVSTQSVDWRGTAEVPSSGPINVLVWPGGETCRLTRNVEPRTEVAFGVFGRHLMVAGGKLPGQVPHTFVGDLSTGILESLEFGLGTRRSRATVTAFGITEGNAEQALVAGGEDPDTQTALGTAEVYVSKPGAPGDLGDFTRERIDLSEQRTKHGAVVLATGETLLVGGTGQFGAPLATMETIDPKTHRYRTSGIATLAVPRTSPTVLRLASGEILVAGGFNRSNQPVPTLEWFSADATHATKRPVDLVTGKDRTFVPLEAGGALAVVIPADGASNISTVWVISADGTLEAGLPIDATGIAKVRLFPGADGAPVLWTGPRFGVPETGRWLRWQPWFAAFQPIPDAPQPVRLPDGTVKENGPSSSSPAIASGDNGLALWLDDTVNGQLFVTGYRFATRTRFGAVRNPLLVDNTLGLAPDRIAGSPGSSIRFDERGGLELGPGASAFVTDVSYADVTVEVDAFLSPAIVLRQENGRELTVGGAECAFAQKPTTTLRVERRGTTVRFAIDNDEPRLCPTELSEGARVSIGVRGPDGAGVSYARNLRITRR